MIKNNQQKAVAERKLDGLRERLKGLRAKHPDEEDFSFWAEATLDQTARMERELAAYELASAGDVEALLDLWNNSGSIQPTQDSALTMGELLALLRVARGLTQQALADTLGLAQANIARYEQRGYTGYSMETLQRLYDALGVRLILGRANVWNAA